MKVTHFCQASFYILKTIDALCMVFYLYLIVSCSFHISTECKTGENCCPETPPDLSISSVPLTPTPSPASPQFTPVVDIDQQTDSNHDTALTLAAAGGHDELVQLLLAKGAAIEHKDKKGENSKHFCLIS